ncbi:GPGG-motif small membrane protein [Aeromicrobium sp. 179-A 4D2 NHS]
MWDTILWIAALIIGIFGIIRLVQRDFVMGAVLIVIALLVGPGGVSLFT